MKQQVVFIHGWEAKENFKSYKDFLYKLEYKPFKIKKRWKNTLSLDLWEDYEVFFPEMPNKDFAVYECWKIMFEKVLPFLREDIILIWHSLWWTFLTKYLDENKFNFKIKKIFLVASAFKDSEDEVLWSFNFDKTLKNFKIYEDDIKFYHSKDDLVVTIDDLEDYRKILEKSEFQIFEDRFHFIDETFPEIIDDIKSL